MTALAYLKWAAIAAVAIGWSWFCYHEGGLATRLAASNAVAKQEASQLHQDSADAKTIAQEASTYDEVIHSDPVEPAHVSVCYYRTPSAAVPRAPAAQPGAPHPAGVSAAPGQPVEATPGPDIGPDLEQLARTADAQVAGLQDYIAKVCRPGAAP